MSTKVTIGWRARAPRHPGFHLYWDIFDGMTEADEGVPRSVHLRVEGVMTELQTLPDGGAAVTMELPIELARALGLVRPTGPP